MVGVLWFGFLWGRYCGASVGLEANTSSSDDPQFQMGWVYARKAASRRDNRVSKMDITPVDQVAWGTGCPTPALLVIWWGYCYGVLTAPE